jgi:hypothetical protein
MSQSDLTGLRETWHHLNTKVFSRLESQSAAAVAKLETSVLKLYLVNCIQTKRLDKAKEFFERLGPDLQGHSEVSCSLVSAY